MKGIAIETTLSEDSFIKESQAGVDEAKQCGGAAENRESGGPERLRQGEVDGCGAGLFGSQRGPRVRRSRVSQEKQNQRGNSKDESESNLAPCGPPSVVSDGSAENDESDDKEDAQQK